MSNSNEEEENLFNARKKVNDTHKGIEDVLDEDEQEKELYKEISINDDVYIFGFVTDCFWHIRE